MKWFAVLRPHYFLLCILLMSAIYAPARYFPCGRFYRRSVTMLLSRCLFLQKRYKHFFSKRRVTIGNIDTTLKECKEDQIDCIPQNKAQLIGRAITHLYSVPGFSRAFWMYVKAIFFDNESSIKGIEYEFERALNLYDNGYDVQGFNFIISAESSALVYSGQEKKSISREFDIIAQKFDSAGKPIDTVWIECKNCDWKKIIKSTLFFYNFKQQLAEQKKIVNVYNEGRNPEQMVTHQLSSKKSLPKKIRQFLADQGTVCHVAEMEENDSAK